MPKISFLHILLKDCLNPTSAQYLYKRPNLVELDKSVGGPR